MQIIQKLSFKGVTVNIGSQKGRIKKNKKTETGLAIMYKKKSFKEAEEAGLAVKEHYPVNDRTYYIYGKKKEELIDPLKSGECLGPESLNEHVTQVNYVD